MRKRTHLFIPCLFAILSGCSWDSSLYDKCVGDDGNVVSCVGECATTKLNIKQSECTGEGLAWVETRCINDANGAILEGVKDEGTCNAEQAHWEPAHCEVTSEFGCYKVKGEWTAYDYDMLDLGNGEYIRRLAENKYACGKFDEVIKATDATTCPAESVKTFETTFEYRICPRNASNCAKYSLGTDTTSSEEESEDSHAMCSSCAEGMAVCYENNKFQCVDLNTNANHCGVCGSKCESTKETPKSCIDGQCIEFECLFTQCDDANHTCINPQDNSTCGATCDNPKGTWCDTEKGLSCTKDKTNSTEEKPIYKCACASEIINSDGYCVNPAANETCGATESNPNGKSCPTGLACRPTAEGNSYECVCAKGWEVTCHVDGSDYCIDPTNDDKHCNAPKEAACTENPQYQCSPSQQCVNSTCVCREGFASCDNKCIDGSMHDDHCGAKGKCNSQKSDSNDYQGIACGANAYCTQSQCKCEEGFILCDGKCISPSYNEYCGATLTGNTCNKGRDCTKENRKSCQKINGSYQCVCDTGYVNCDGTCIDPLTTSQHCGKYTPDIQCKSLTNCKKQICVDGECTDNCPENQIACPISANENVCVKQSIYQLEQSPNNCTKCAEGFCPNASIGNNNYFNENRCLDPDGHNRLHTIYNCSSCGDICPNTYECIQNNNNYTCACPSGTKECTISGSLQKQCFNLAQLHKKDCDTCEDEWADCNGNAEDGCEVHITDDKENCGQCNNNCERTLSSMHVSGIVCLAKQCQFTSCESGYGNCDNDQENGCETNLTTKEACGSCGNNCTSQYSEGNHSEITCQEGSCLKACVSGYADCDNKGHNGCETNITSSVRNCGGCGKMCDSEYYLDYYLCKNSQCCNKDDVDIYSYELCCNKKFRKWNGYYQEYMYRCAKKKPDNSWTEVQQQSIFPTTSNLWTLLGQLCIFACGDFFSACEETP